MKEIQIWQPIQFTKEWLNADTSRLDDISPSWFKKRNELKDDSREYQKFLTRLKRQHAIETGIIERLYDLKEGVTETFIKEGFVESYLQHGDTNIPSDQLMGHLHDNFNAIEFVFDVVKNNRPLTKGFICELHKLTTNYQETTEGINQFGKKVTISLRKGEFKKLPNNPQRNKDGVIVKYTYCDPIHVESEIDNLIKIYNKQVEKDTHPVIVATWFHHAFTQIHPFQDGNGRLARLLASLILIKFGYFPLTVTREERAKYITALEKADKGQPQPLIDHFCEIQRRNIAQALNITEVPTDNLDDVTTFFANQLKQFKSKIQEEHVETLARNREQIFQICNAFLNEKIDETKIKLPLDDETELYITSCSPKSDKQHYFFKQIVQYANRHDYYFNKFLPRAWFRVRFRLFDIREYQLVITIHHYGYDDVTMTIGAFLEIVEKNETMIIPIETPPHLISIGGDITEKMTRNIEIYLRDIITIAFGRIARDL